mmetsp:Transcript_46651/g.149846  ORF Transcript_46651/g.149846 Transcript_46651/m.149846 type:complete len:214 (-) Transcript_46651:582-1223(-)
MAGGRPGEAPRLSWMKETLRCASMLAGRIICATPLSWSPRSPPSCPRVRAAIKSASTSKSTELSPTGVLLALSAPDLLITLLSKRCTAVGWNTALQSMPRWMSSSCTSFTGGASGEAASTAPHLIHLGVKVSLTSAHVLSRMATQLLCAAASSIHSSSARGSPRRRKERVGLRPPTMQCWKSPQVTTILIFSPGVLRSEGRLRPTHVAASTAS